AARRCAGPRAGHLAPAGGPPTWRRATRPAPPAPIRRGRPPPPRSPPARAWRGARQGGGRGTAGGGGAQRVRERVFRAPAIAHPGEEPARGAEAIANGRAAPHAAIPEAECAPVEQQGERAPAPARAPRAHELAHASRA